MANGEISGGGVRPTSHFTSTSMSYRPSNSVGLSSGGSSGNGGTSGDSIDFTDYIVTPDDMELYKSKEVTGSLGIEGSEIKEKSWIEKLAGSGFMRVANTYANFWLAMNDGAISLTEKIADGAIWSTKATMCVIMSGGNKVISIFNPDFAKELDAGKNAVDDWFKDKIAFSVTNWWRDMLNDTGFMKQVNSNTYLEYGKETSNKIADVSETIQTYIGAAISSKVWGGCLAIMLGGCYGSGEQAEKLYSTRDETGVREELSILFSGCKEAAKWFTVAKITQSVSSMFSSGGNGAGGLSTFAENAKEFGKQTFSNFKATNAEVWHAFKTEGIKGTLNPFTKYLGEFFSNPYYDMKLTEALTRNFDDYFSGEKEFTIGSMLNDVIYSFGYMISGSARLNLGTNGGTYSVPQYGLTFLTPKLVDWVQKKLGIEDIGAKPEDENNGSTPSEEDKPSSGHHGSGGKF